MHILLFVINVFSCSYTMCSKPNTFIGGKLAFQCQSSFSISPAHHINRSRKKPHAFWTRYFWINGTFSDQWAVGPMIHFFGPMIFGPMTLSDKWVFGPMGFRTNGSSDQWVFGLMGLSDRLQQRHYWLKIIYRHYNKLNTIFIVQTCPNSHSLWVM